MHLRLKDRRYKPWRTPGSSVYRRSTELPHPYTARTLGIGYWVWVALPQSPASQTRRCTQPGDPISDSSPKVRHRAPSAPLLQPIPCHRAQLSTAYPPLHLRRHEPPPSLHRGGHCHDHGDPHIFLELPRGLGQPQLGPGDRQCQPGRPTTVRATLQDTKWWYLRSDVAMCSGHPVVISMATAARR